MSTAKYPIKAKSKRNFKFSQKNSKNLWRLKIKHYICRRIKTDTAVTVNEYGYFKVHKKRD